MMGLMGKSSVHHRSTIVRELGLQLDELGFMVILAIVLMRNPRSIEVLTWESHGSGGVLQLSAESVPQAPFRR